MPEFSESRRRAVFAALVNLQDHGALVSSSRRSVGGRFGLGVDEVRQIEREGLDCQWPPLPPPPPGQPGRPAPLLPVRGKIGIIHDPA